MYGQPQVAQAVAVAQPVSQQMYGQPQQMYYGQPQQMYGQPQPMAPAIAVAQPVYASPQPAMGVAAPQGKKHESVHAFGFMPDYMWKNSARNLDGFYISCTGTPMFWFDADINPCPALILCCAMPCYIPYPCPAVRPSEQLHARRPHQRSREARGPLRGEPISCLRCHQWHLLLARVLMERPDAREAGRGRAAAWVHFQRLRLVLGHTCLWHLSGTKVGQHER